MVIFKFCLWEIWWVTSTLVTVVANLGSGCAIKPHQPVHIFSTKVHFSHQKSSIIDSDERLSSNRKHLRTSYKKNSLIEQQNLRLSCIGEKLVCENKMRVSSKDERCRAENLFPLGRCSLLGRRASQFVQGRWLIFYFLWRLPLFLKMVSRIYSIWDSP